MENERILTVVFLNDEFFEFQIDMREKDKAALHEYVASKTKEGEVWTCVDYTEPSLVESLHFIAKGNHDEQTH